MKGLKNFFLTERNIQEARVRLTPIVLLCLLFIYLRKTEEDSTHLAAKSVLVFRLRPAAAKIALYRESLTIRQEGSFSSSNLQTSTWRPTTLTLNCPCRDRKAQCTYSIKPRYKTGITSPVVHVSDWEGSQCLPGFYCQHSDKPIRKM